MRLTRRSVLGGLGGATVAGAGGTFAYGQLAAAEEGGAPTALVAGSLLGAARRLSGAAVEAHGSAAVRRLVLDDLRDPDAVALADPVLFSGISDRATRFATNALVLAYDPRSPHADALAADWAGALAAEVIRLGRTDPRADPLGYRTVMALRLAARDYGIDPTAVLARSRTFRETDLLAVLEGGGVDAAFAYRNMAVARDLPFVALPDRIDFSNPAHADRYATVSYELPGTTVRGAPIEYAATATTARGVPWVRRLVTATDLLADAGFLVPSGYPVFSAPVG